MGDSNRTIVRGTRIGTARLRNRQNLSCVQVSDNTMLIDLKTNPHGLQYCKIMRQSHPGVPGLNEDQRKNANRSQHHHMAQVQSIN